MFIECSSNMRTLISKCTDEFGTSAIFKPQITLFNPDTEFTFTPRYLKAFNINQLFDDLEMANSNTMDQCSCTLDLTVEEYREIMENLQGLECTITLVPYSLTYMEEELDSDPIIFDAKVITNGDDISKSASPQSFENMEAEANDEKISPSQAQAQITKEFQLIPKEDYEARNIKTNVILQDVTVKDVIMFFCNSLGEDIKLDMVEPDNKMKYSSIIIPPQKSIHNLFPFLQERYGIYSKGVGFYLSNKVLKVYPANQLSEDLEPGDPVLRIALLPNKNLQGNDHYHVTEDDDLWVLSITPNQITELSTQGAENNGNVHVATNADSVQSDFVTIEKDGSVKMGENNVSVISSTNKAATSSAKSQNIVYDGETTNIYHATADMSKLDGAIINIGWTNARPWIATSGMHVVVYYDALTVDVNESIDPLTGEKERRIEKYLDFREAHGILQKAVYSSKTVSLGNGKTPGLLFGCELQVKMESFDTTEEVNRRKSEGSSSYSSDSNDFFS